jgi:hypothetical protein
MNDCRLQHARELPILRSATGECRISHFHTDMTHTSVAKHAISSWRSKFDQKRGVNFLIGLSRAPLTFMMARMIWSIGVMPVPPAIIPTSRACLASTCQTKP